MSKCCIIGEHITTSISRSFLLARQCDLSLPSSQSLLCKRTRKASYCLSFTDRPACRLHRCPASNPPIQHRKLCKTKSRDWTSLSHTSAAKRTKNPSQRFGVSQQQHPPTDRSTFKETSIASVSKVSRTSLLPSKTPSLPSTSAGNQSKQNIEPWQSARKFKPASEKCFSAVLDGTMPNNSSRKGRWSLYAEHPYFRRAKQD